MKKIRNTVLLLCLAFLICGAAACFSSPGQGEQETISAAWETNFQTDTGRLTEPPDIGILPETVDPETASQTPDVIEETAAGSEPVETIASTPATYAPETVPTEPAPVSETEKETSAPKTVPETMSPETTTPETAPKETIAVNSQGDILLPEVP